MRKYGIACLVKKKLMMNSASDTDDKTGDLRNIDEQSSDTDDKTGDQQNIDEQCSDTDKTGDQRNIDKQSVAREDKTDGKSKGREKEKDEEEDVQAKVRGVQYDTCLHPNSSVASAQKEYCIAPGEGKSPLDPFMDKKCEALAFPQLFPTGKGTFLGDDEEVKRTVSLTPKKILHTASFKCRQQICIICVLLIFCSECV